MQKQSTSGINATKLFSIFAIHYSFTKSLILNCLMVCLFDDVNEDYYPFSSTPAVI